MSGAFHHIPVLLDEVLGFLEPERGGIFIDGTLGGGGHAEAVLRRLPEPGKLIGIDRDWEAVRAAKDRLQAYGNRFTALHGNFFHMTALLAEIGVGAGKFLHRLGDQVAGRGNHRLRSTVRAASASSR